MFDLNTMVNKVQSSNVGNDTEKAIIVKAVQEYYKILCDAQAIKPKKKAKKVVKKATKKDEE